MDLYPPENKALAEKITASGAVVSEFPMTFAPTPQTFPYRNRIVAGWGSGVLVVEAGFKSGALITANQALDHGRLVYSVPGPIDRPTSLGTNRLIQQGAKLVMSADDILDDLQSLFPRQAKISEAAPAFAADLSPEEQAVMAALGSTETSVDSLAVAAQLPVHKVAALLFTLEVKRQVKQLPGQLFVRLV
jgi:DNA processing protein